MKFNLHPSYSIICHLLGTSISLIRLAQASAGHNIRSAEDTNNSAATDGVWRVCNFEDPGGAWGLGATMFLRANH